MHSCLVSKPKVAGEAAAWATILPLLTSGRVKPIVERAYELDEAAEALRHLIEDRPFGRVMLRPSLTTIRIARTSASSIRPLRRSQRVSACSACQGHCVWWLAPDR